MLEKLRNELLITIQKTFHYNTHLTEKLFIELMLCVNEKQLVNVARYYEDNRKANHRG